MKNFKNLKFTHFTPLRLVTTNFNAFLSVKAGTRLINAFKAIVISIGVAVTPSRIRLIVLFLRTITRLYKTQGAKGLVLNLKTSAVLLQQSIGGHIIPHPRLVSKTAVARSKAGLPRLIPAQARMAIRNGDVALMRLYLSLFNTYRLITFVGKVDIQSITAPSIGNHTMDEYMLKAIPVFVEKFVFASVSPATLLLRLTQYARDSVFPIIKSAPGTSYELREFSSQPHIVLRNFVKLLATGHLYNSIHALASESSNRTLLQLMEGFLQHTTLLADSGVPTTMLRHGSLGKLGFKQEAAGKIRVFAMVDSWTQWVLQPYHKVYFDILKTIPMDGTFDQLKPLAAVIKNNNGLWSLDLSSATDRLPMGLQTVLFGHIFQNKDLGIMWRNLLTGRSYKAGMLSPCPGEHHYSVGQPMGALTS
jgi:hypothetical protein